MTQRKAMLVEMGQESLRKIFQEDRRTKLTQEKKRQRRKVIYRNQKEK